MNNDLTALDNIYKHLEESYFYMLNIGVNYALFPTIQPFLKFVEYAIDSLARTLKKHRRNRRNVPSDFLITDTTGITMIINMMITNEHNLMYKNNLRDLRELIIDTTIIQYYDYKIENYYKPYDFEYQMIKTKFINEFYNCCRYLIKLHYYFHGIHINEVDKYKLSISKHSDFINKMRSEIERTDYERLEYV